MKAHTTNDTTFSTLALLANHLTATQQKLWHGIEQANSAGELTTRDIQDLIEIATGTRPSTSTTYRQLARHTDRIDKKRRNT